MIPYDFFLVRKVLVGIIISCLIIFRCCHFPFNEISRRVIRIKGLISCLIYLLCTAPCRAIIFFIFLVHVRIQLFLVFHSLFILRHTLIFLNRGWTWIIKSWWGRRTHLEGGASSIVVGLIQTHTFPVGILVTCWPCGSMAAFALLSVPEILEMVTWRWGLACLRIFWVH